MHIISIHITNKSSPTKENNLHSVFAVTHMKYRLRIYNFNTMYVGVAKHN